jgi:hypothetical protein
LNDAQENGRLIKTLGSGLAWIVSLACIEQEYADIVELAFGTEWTNWIIAGHLPCDWEGLFPNQGMLVVY